MKRQCAPAVVLLSAGVHGIARVRAHTYTRQVQQQAHAAVMLRMQAEVQSLQDQLAFARAVGDEPSATNADDVTLSGQLSRAKTKMAKLEVREGEGGGF